MKKIKTYYLTLSQVFPSTHIRAGQATDFKIRMLAALNGLPCYMKKLHTIRQNYEFWRKRFEKIDAGEAVLSIREWVGEPYTKGSTQRELALLTREDGIGIQEVMLNSHKVILPAYRGWASKIRIEDGEFEYKFIPSERLAYNDGLSFEDWYDWFKGCDTAKSFAIIHFTNFRY